MYGVEARGATQSVASSGVCAGFATGIEGNVGRVGECLDGVAPVCTPSGGLAGLESPSPSI